MQVGEEAPVLEQQHAAALALQQPDQLQPVSNGVHGMDELELADGSEENDGAGAREERVVVSLP